jgi:hypothetical protein
MLNLNCSKLVAVLVAAAAMYMTTTSDTLSVSSTFER